MSTSTFPPIVFLLILSIASDLNGQGAAAAQPSNPAKAPQESTGNQDIADGLMQLLSKPEFFQVDVNRGIIYAANGVEVQLGTRLVRCDNLIAWVDLDRSEREKPSAEEGTKEEQAFKRYVKEFYAEGNVVYKTDGQWTHCDRFFLDVRKERGLALDATAALPLRTRDRDTEIVVRATELRILSGDRIQGSGVQTWTGPFGRPFTNLTADEIEIIREDLVGSDPNDPNRPKNYNIRSTGNVLRLGSFPVMWVPDFAGNTASDGSSFLIQSVRLNSSNEFGQRVGVSVGDDIEIGDGRRWGRWSTHLDWYSKRGPAIGVDVTYDKSSYRGFIKSRYQRDHGNDQAFGPPPTKNRGRLSWWHRQTLPFGVQLDTELQLLSDRGYLPTWEEDDDKGLKPPENLIYLKKAFFNSMVTGLVSARFNDWFTRVEHQPQLRYDLIAEPLFDIAGHPVYYSVTARAGNSRIRYDDDLNLGSLSTWRADVDNLVEYAFLADPFKITPFAGLRYSYYERDIDGNENRDRIGFTYGGTINLQAWKSFEANGGLFSLDGLRHILIPEVTFRNTVGVDVNPADLIPLDEVETFDDVQMVEFRLRNLFQTLRHRQQGTQVDTIIDVELELQYFPNPRDNAGDPFGNLDADVLIRFRDDLQFVSDFEVNWYGRGIEVGNAAVGYTPSRDFQAYAGFRHFHQTYDAVFLQTNWRIDEKWLTTIETAYDFNDNRGIDHRVVFSRIGPEWVFRVGFRADLGEDDFSVIFSFEPRFLFDPVLRSGQLRSEPRLYFLGSGFGK